MKPFICLYIVLGSYNLFGQSNLVQNSSFEEHSDCPVWIGQLQLAYHWSAGHGSLDYYNVCVDTMPGFNPAGVPLNPNGYQVPHTGVAYAGFVSYSNPVSNYREYMQTVLLDSLIEGEEYEVSFYLSLADSKEGNAIGPVGVYFMNDSLAIPGGLSNLSLCCTPQITFYDFPTEIVDWKKVSANYVASGGERLMVIGNFEINSNCIFMQDPEFALSSYFLIDDVSVMRVENSEKPETTIEMPNVFSPNDDNINDVFQPIIYSNIQNTKLVVLNRWGEKVFETDTIVEGWDGLSNGQKCPNGTYFWTLEFIDLNGEAGLKSGFIQLVR